MTGNQFIEQIREKGAFVRAEDMESLISFYESKLLSAKSADEEERIVASFGDPDEVIRRIKAEYVKLQLNTEPPLPKEEQKKETIEEIKEEIPAPVSTPKDQQGDDDEDMKIFPRKKDVAPSVAPAKKNNTPTPSPKSDASPARRKYYGIVNSLLDRMKLKGQSRTTGKIALSVLFSPLFLFPFLGIVLLFLLAMAGITATVALLLLIEAALIIVSVVELIYAILSFFTSIPVALIELGLGTVLVAFAVAVTALVYQLLTGVIPLAARKVNRLRKSAFTNFFELFFGSKGGKA